MTMTSQFAAMTSLSFFCHYFLSLVKFIYWSMFNINIITGSGVLDQKSGNWKFPCLGFAEIRIYLETGASFSSLDTKFGKKVSNKFILYLAKYQGYSLYGFCVIKGKPTGGKITQHPPRLGGCFFYNLITWNYWKVNKIC